MLAVALLLIRDDRQLDAYTYTIGLVGVILLLLPVVPGVGYEINGARLWVDDRARSRSSRRSSAKIFIVIFLASLPVGEAGAARGGSGRLGLPRVKDLGPLLLAWGASLAVLFLERDMGASLLFFGVFVVMVWVASGRPGYLVVGLLLFAAGAFIGYLAFSHVQLRVDYWLHALDPAKVHDIGYGQLAQGWFAMASGGLVGTGLGQGSPTLIPYVGSDFIFAAFGEELGMIGAAGLLLLYLVLIGRGLRIAIERTDAFGKLLATGITTIFALQTFAIVARRDAPDPAHRRAAAARLVRRLEPRGDLRHARAAAARLGGTLGAVAWIGRSAGSGSRSRSLFGVLFAQMAYVQVFAADRIRNDPANATPADHRRVQGGARGHPLAGRTRARRERQGEGPGPTTSTSATYPNGPLYAAITGFYSRVYGRTALESVDERLPLGRRTRAGGLELHRPGAGQAEEGRDRRDDDPTPTCRQAAAAGARRTSPGAVVAVEPGSGDVMAMVANPTYDPNLLSHGTADDMKQAWTALQRRSREAAAVAREGRAVPAGLDVQDDHGLGGVRDTGTGPRRPWTNPHVLDLPLTSGTLENFGGELCNGGSATVTVAEAFKESCNVPFAEIGLDLGPKKLSEQARAFGFCPTDPPDADRVHRPRP